MMRPSDDVTREAIAADLAGPFSPHDVEWRKLEIAPAGAVARWVADGREFLCVAPAVLEQMAAEAFRDAAFLLRRRQLDQWAAILRDPAAHPNERYVVAGLIRNAIIAAEGVLPLCQDTGTATIVAHRGERVLTGGEDRAQLAAGIARAYREHALRYSQLVAHEMFAERNTGTNLPAQIDIEFSPGSEYHFLCIAKGGGSSNKTFLSQESTALLNETALEAFLRARIAALGVAACPPYHLVVVIGGTSPEANLKTLKLAGAGALDHLPPRGDESGRAFRDLNWETRVQTIAVETGLGAQFGGRWLALDARVIRLPRHAGSCPVSVGVSCSAHRNLLGKITGAGAFLERLDPNPGRLMSELATVGVPAAVRVNLDRPMSEIITELERLEVGALVLLSGPLVVARDMAHARLFEARRAGRPLPEYFKHHAIYYAGPAKTPPGAAVGSFGPTTAQRMDGYLDTFMREGASLVTLAKGNRSGEVAAACRNHRGFYLGTIGGAAALTARENIVSSELLDFPELGMEAVRRIMVRDFPAFIIVDSRGRSLY